MGRIANGYKTFRRGNWRFQIYYPHVTIEKGNILFRCDACFRVAWPKAGKDYRYTGFAVVCIFGIGFDHEVRADGTKETPEPT